MDASNANLFLVQQEHEALNSGDVNAAAEIFAEDSRNHGRQVGRAGVRAVLNDIQSTFPDFQMTILNSVVEGEWVVVRCTFSGTHRGLGRIPVNGGMLVGVQPTGMRFEVQHIHMYQLRNGKIVEHFANRDDLGMMRQLGLLPPRNELLAG
ncbi:MAG TPA: ester cyclase [Candidatus Acidoferrales bacterium]|jgi:predicted ester cyclase|nr:ester cyclase [Candidatus Acidoferrales bacterium]